MTTVGPPFLAVAYGVIADDGEMSGGRGGGGSNRRSERRSSLFVSDFVRIAIL